ncbi:MAG: hypothetical protein PF689_09310 [Deltaproteobacteria bacterium]|jgi:hypothetical protein|nr:hypothetical protein [Deltaproteobacteria bacterium]
MKKLLLVVLMVSILPEFARADEKMDFVSDKPKSVLESKKKKKAKYGWDGLLKTSGSISWAHSDNVMGQTDGATWNIGYILNGKLAYLSKKGHEWSNNLNWQLNYLKTPLLDEFAKGMDNFEISSAYLFHIPDYEWMGPFAQLGLKTAIMDGYYLAATPMNVEYRNPKGEPIETVAFATQERIDLTKFFSPLVIKQSLGYFLKPLTKKQAKVFIQAGGGAWEIFGRNGWAVRDDAATTDTLEVQKIEDTFQVGAELSVGIEGVIRKNFNYELKANLLYPFYHNSETDMTGMDLLNMDFEVKAGLKLNKYVSINYSFKAVKMPLVSEEWQIQNGVVLSFNMTLLEPKKPKKKKKEEKKK